MNEHKEKVATAIKEIKTLTDVIAKNRAEARLASAFDEINKMLGSTWFSVCPITQFLDSNNIKYSFEDENLKALRDLHCVDYSSMPPNIRSSLPLLIAVVIFGEEVAYGLTEVAPNKPNPRRIKGYLCPADTDTEEHPFGATITMLPRGAVEKKETTPRKKFSFWKFIFGDLLKDDPE